MADNQTHKARNTATAMIAKRLLSQLGLDRAISYTLVAKVFSAVSSILIIMLAATQLSEEAQGYYYTFNSVLGLQILVELGLSVVLVQVIAHRMGNVTWHKGNLKGPYSDIERVLDVVSKVLRWYLVLTGLVAALLLFFGTFFLTFVSNATVVTGWYYPWIVLSSCFCFHFLATSVFPLFEGMGRVADVAKIRFVGSTAAYIVCFLAFLSGHGLYAPACIFGVASCVYVPWLFTGWRKNIILNAIIKRSKGNSLSWIQHVFPMQWRIAISWISGFAIFHLFAPAMMYYQGAKVAGQVGISFAALNGIGTLAMSWVATKAPRFGLLISEKKFNELDQLFYKTLFQSAVVSLFFILTFLGLMISLAAILPEVSDRFLPISTLIILSYVAVLNHYVFSMAVYLRAHKNEPLLMNSVFSALFISTVIIILGPRFGVHGMMIGYGVVASFSSLWVFGIFRRQQLNHVVG